MKVTLDTNVLVSGTFWTGTSFRILDAIDKNRLEHVTSKEIVKEYNETINSDEIIDKVRNKSLVVSILCIKLSRIPLLLCL